MSARTVEDVLRAVGEALRDPALSQNESAAVASVMITEACLYGAARSALELVRDEFKDHPGLKTRDLVNLLQGYVSARSRPTIRRGQGDTNVIKACFLKASFMLPGEGQPRTLSADDVRDELRRARDRARGDLLGDKRVANDNDSETTVTERWFRRIQGAAVERAKARREQRDG